MDWHESHAHSLNRGGTKALAMALTVTLSFAILEVVGGWLSGSLALMSDSGHMFTDSLALALSLWAARLALRPSDERRTYGLLRAEILMALVNGVLLAGVSLFILYESYLRLQEPPKIESGLMLAVAIVGAMANIVSVFILRSSAHHNLNVKAALMHVLGDLMSSVGVIIAALLIFFYGLYVADPLFSIAIALIILYGSYRIISQSVYILLEFVPKSIDLIEVKEKLLQVKGVLGVHDLHAWTIASGVYALSAHIQVEDQPLSAVSNIMKECERVLKERFNISHTTLQLESVSCGDQVCFFNKAYDETGE
ncbi:MAG: cation diffusion facilitator family transporter [Methanomassiliicoccales archaeon]